MSGERPRLVTAFQQFFEILPADAPDLQDAALRIRFAVYCQELAYEPIEAFPDGRERDAYDGQSRFCLLRHRASGEFSGCVRLVLNDPAATETPLPFERLCEQSLRREVINPAKLPRDRFGEISRLAVISRFRRRAGEHRSPHGVGDEVEGPTADERRVFPHISLGLYLAAAAMGLREGLDLVFVMMEPRLARHMRRYGIEFTQAGDVIDYHGQRGPFFITREALYANLEPEVRELLDLIRSAIATEGGPATPRAHDLA